MKSTGHEPARSFAEAWVRKRVGETSPARPAASAADARTPRAFAARSSSNADRSDRKSAVAGFDPALVGASSVDDVPAAALTSRRAEERARAGTRVIASEPAVPGTQRRSAEAAGRSLGGKAGRARCGRLETTSVRAFAAIGHDLAPRVRRRSAFVGHLPNGEAATRDGIRASLQLILIRGAGRPLRGLCRRA
jgi:hypothetical protein